MTKNIWKGEPLEARIQRLFLAQGIFAERSLKVVTGQKHSKKTATDIDVLSSEYASSFHLTRGHTECKGGSDFRILDRTFWMHGVKDLLGASASYLVLDEHDPEVLEFARDLGIELLTLDSVEKMEASYAVPTDAWPCRSNYSVFSPLLDFLRREIKRKDETALSQMGAMLTFVEEESWLHSRYGILNKLLRQFEILARLAKEGQLESPLSRALATYCAGALAVRLAQYLMFVCRDVLTMGSLTRAEYLKGRLSHGDQDPQTARSLVQASVTMAKSALAEHKITLPARWDVDVLLSPPPYSDSFLQMIEKFIESSSDSRYAAIAAEVHHFGDQGNSISKFARLIAAAKAGGQFAALIRGFVVQSFGLPNEFLTPFDAKSAMESFDQVNKSAEKTLPT